MPSESDFSAAWPAPPASLQAACLRLPPRPTQCRTLSQGSGKEVEWKEVRCQTRGLARMTIPLGADWIATIGSRHPFFAFLRPAARHVAAAAAVAAVAAKSAVHAWSDQGALDEA